MSLQLEAIALILSIVVAAADLYARRVPNGWLLGGLLLGAICLVAAASWPLLRNHAIGLALGLLSLLPFFLIRLMGAGDVKFFAVLGWLLGWQALLPIWLVASLLAGLHAIAVLGLRRVPPYPPVLALGQRWQGSRMVQACARARGDRRGAPYAAFLAAGAAIHVFKPLF